MGSRGTYHQVVSEQGPHTKHGAPGDGSQREMYVLRVLTHLAFFLLPLPFLCRIFDTVYREPFLMTTSHSSLPEWPPGLKSTVLTKIFHLQLCQPLLSSSSSWFFVLTVILAFSIKPSMRKAQSGVRQLASSLHCIWQITLHLFTSLNFYGKVRI